MRFLLGFIIFALMASPVLAIGNVTVNGTNMAPVYVNTRVVYNFLNISLNATAGTINVTSFNVTVKGVGVGNITLVRLINESGSVIASNTTWNTTTNYTVLSPSGGVDVSINRSLLIAINISYSAARTSNITVNLSSGLTTNNTADNISIFAQSIGAQVQDLHVNATITPRNVDTNVANQSFVYSFVYDGQDRIYGMNVTLPFGFSTPYVSNVEDSSNLSLASSDYSVTTSLRTFNISFGSGGVTLRSGPRIKVFFNTSTNSSTTISAAINSTVSGSNFTSLPSEVNDATNNVTMKQLVNVSSVSITKSTAIVNGTDYWEFNFTLNFTANITGNLQMNLTNWTSALGNIPLTNLTGDGFYTSLRDNGNWSNIMNVTNVYNKTVAVQGCCTEGTVYYVLLRMIIPTGTAVTNSWSTTYNFLFRST
ncbi:MAG: hypothetical protein HYW27_04120 [Candidatus Aenigmarchaeota archaeon]|nr:hypothetical protein [Candidatus Aenigmarchaeota archaeon]